MKRLQRPELDNIIRSLLNENPSCLNVVMAETASRELGMQITTKQISRVRNEIGMGDHSVQMIHLFNELQKNQRQTRR